MKKSIFKKILALALSVSMVASTATVGFADELILEEPAGYDEEISFDEPAAAETEAPVVEEQEIIEEQDAVQDEYFADDFEVIEDSQLFGEQFAFESADYMPGVDYSIYQDTEDGCNEYGEYLAFDAFENAISVVEQDMGENFGGWYDSNTGANVTDFLPYKETGGSFIAAKKTTFTFYKTKKDAEAKTNAIKQEGPFSSRAGNYSVAVPYETEATNALSEGEEFNGWNLLEEDGSLTKIDDFTTTTDQRVKNPFYKDLDFVADISETKYTYNFYLLDKAATPVYATDTVTISTVYTDKDADHAPTVADYPDAYATGYTFDYWTYNGEEVDFRGLPTINSDKNFIAYFAANEYTIELDPNEGEFDPEIENPITYTYDGDAITLPSADGETKISRNGYTFGGWKTEGGTIVDTIDNDLVADADPETPITLTAVWTPTDNAFYFYLTEEDYEEDNEYYVDTNGVNVESTKYAVVSPYAPTPEDGYTFLGWTEPAEDPEAIVDFTTLEPATDFDRDRYFVASIEANTYTVTLDPDGGVFADPTFEEPVVFVYDTEAIALPTEEEDGITRNGYTLTKWIDVTTGEEVEEINNATVLKYADEDGNVSFMAQWELDSYTFTFYLSEEDLKAENAYKVDTNEINVESSPYAVESPYAPTPEAGWTFVGWTEPDADDPTAIVNFKEMPVSEFNRDRNFVASFVPVVYTVTLDPNGGTLEGEDTFEIQAGDEAYDLPTEEDITRTGYNFDGWTIGEDTYTSISPEDAIANADEENKLTVTANWERGIYELKYDLDGGDWAESDKDKVKYEYSVKSKTFTLPTPVRENYEFAGWIIDGKGDPQLTVTYRKGSADGPHDFTATWIANEFSIKYALAKGKLPEGKENPTTYTKDSDDITLVNPERIGYEFAGWTGTDLLEPTMEVVIPSGSTGDREYTATWERGIYEITYDLQDGNWPLDEEGNEIVGKSPYSVKSPTFTLPKPEKLFYDFAGWVLEGSEEEPVEEVTIEKGSADGPRTYIAVWTPTEYNVYLDANGGEWDVEDKEWFTITIDDEPKTLPGSDALHKDGSVFGGWVFDGMEAVFTDSIDFYTVASNADEFNDFHLSALWLEPVAYVVEDEEEVYFASLTDAVNYVKENMAPETPIHIVSQPDDPYLLTEENETIYVIPEAEIDEDALFWNDNDSYYIQKDYLEEAIAYTLMRKVFVFFSSEEDLENGSDPYTVSFVEETTETAEELLPAENPEMEGAVFEGWKEAFAEEDGWVYGDVIPVEEWAELDFSYRRYFVASFAPYVAEINKVGFFATFEEAVKAFYNDNPKNYAVRMLRQPAEDDMAEIDPDAKALKINYNYVVEGEEEFDVAANLDFNRDVFKLNVSDPDKNGNQRYTLASYVFTFFKEANEDVTEETEPYYEVEVAYIDEDHPISPAEVPEAEDGYVFAGWEDFQGNLVEVFEDYLGGDASFCGSYAPEEYNITYLDEGTPIDLAPATYTIEDEFNLPSAGNKEGYTFDCWLDENGEKATTIALGSTGDKTFTAQWKANAKPYKIILTASAGASAAPTMDPAGGTYDYRTEVALTAAAPQSGYEFAGWYNKKGKLISKKNPYKVLVMSDVTLEARYVPVN